MSTPPNRFPPILDCLIAFGLAVTTLPASAQLPDTLKHTILPPPVGSQSGAGLGSSVAVDGGFVVCGAPLDDTGATDGGVVKVFDSATGALRLVLPNPSPAANDQFGHSVAISGTRVVVGAQLDDSGATDAGSAYVYDLSSGTPTVPVFTLNKPSPAANDQFGYSVAISGMRVVVGAPFDDPASTDAGSAYVYDLANGTPTVPVLTLNKPIPHWDDYFGSAVAISGTRVIVGAFFDDTGASDAGSAYIFDLNSGTPTVPVTILNNPSPAFVDYFGYSVAISGLRVVVGDRALAGGSAYVYDLGSGTPSVPMATLHNSNPAASDEFGFSVAISNTRVVVGSIYDDTGAPNTGRAFVFDMAGGTPTVPVAILSNPSPGDGDRFGQSVSISGMLVVVGASKDDTGASDAGSAYIYDLGRGTPTVPTATLNNPGPVAGDAFGQSVAISGRWMVVGAHLDDTGATDAGSAHVYDLGSATPTIPIFTLNNPSPATGDAFGAAVAISGTRVVVGAPYDDAGATNAGSAYVYDLSSGTPTVPVATLNNSSPGTDDWFGYSVAVSGTRVVAGAYQDDTSGFNSGSAYVYDLTGGTPAAPIATLHNPSPAESDYFGLSVAISGSIVVVGGISDSTGAYNAGSAYIYDLGGGSPTVPVFTINNPAPAVGDWFGYSVAISGMRVVVGARLDDAGATDAGSAYVYDLGGGTPTVPVATLNNPAPGANDRFGFSVGISGTRVVVTAKEYDAGAADVGIAYLYDMSSGAPAVPVATLPNFSPAANDQFGGSVAIDGFTVAIGAPLDDTAMADKGAIYVYGPLLDTSFTPLADSDVSAAALQADGKLLIGGGFSNIDGVARNYVARLNPDGTVDPGFNSDADFTVASLAVQNDGKVLIGGAFNNVGGVSRNYLARLDSNGSVDASFNPDLDYVVSGLLVQADGKIVIGGSFTTVGGITRNRIARLSADGTLDSGFNPDVDGDVLCLALQGDGKILVGGNFTTVAGVVRNGIARLNANGSLDTGFNPNTNLEVMSLAVQADGKLVIGGAFTTVGGVARNHCARLNGDGSLDLTFNPNVNGNVVSTAIRVDGSIVLGGSFTAVGGTTRHGVARLSATGSLDTNFAPSADDAVTCVMIDAEGRIALGGFFTLIDGVPRSHFARLTADASTQSLTVPDLNQVRWLRAGSAVEVATVAFELSTDGGAHWSLLGPGIRTVGGWELTGLSLPVGGQIRARARTAGGQANGSSGLLETVTSFSFLNANAEVVSAALQPDGKTVVGGRFTSVGTVARNRLARFNANGTLDAAFNPDVNNAVLGTVVQADGKLVICGGFTTVGGVPRNNVARLNADGTLETAFNPGTNAAVNSIGLQADGKIVLGGSFTNAGGSTRNRCARLNATGALDTGFNPNVNGAVNSVAVQADGKIVIGGAFTSVGSARNGMARLNTTGSLDTTFNPNVTGGSVSCLTIQADGKILLGGSFTTVGGTARNRLARINTDGSLDTSFNADADGTVTSIVVQADGKILIGGSFTALGATSRGRLARLLADGTVDPTFTADANDSISCLALKADGKLLVGGSFTAIAGSSISFLALVANDAATQSLTVPNYSRVQWLRGGTSPETSQVTFELSTDGGTVWSSLGTGTRIAGGWEKTGLDLTGNGLVRARARTRGGQSGGSSGLLETVASYTGFVPEIAVEQPAGTNITDGGSKDFGNVVVGSNASLTFTILNSGRYPLTGIGITIDGANSGDFSVTTSPTAPLAGGGSTMFTVRFAPTATGPRGATLHIASNDADEVPFDIALNGTGLFPGNIDPLFNPNVTGSLFDATAVQPDGKIVIGGLFTSVGGQARSNIARLNPDGTLESSATFNPGTGANERVSGIAIQSDGKIVIVGSFTGVNGQPRNRIARLNADGSVESTMSFNVGTGANDFVNTVAIQPDGKILLVGNFTTFNGQARNRVARLNTDGSLESTATFNPSSGAFSVIYGLALQADGKILLAGYLNDLSGQPRLIARLHPNGALEDTSTFNPPTVITDARSFCVAVQPDGKILVGGEFSSVDGQTRVRIARLHANGSVESTSTFSPGSGANAKVYSIALQADGKILMAGDFNTVNDLPRGGVARLLPNGVVEDTTTFNIGTGAIGGGNSTASGVAVAADGSILLGGRFTSFNGVTRNHLLRLVNEAAIQSLAIPNSNRVAWSRGGAAPEVIQVTFEHSNDGGATWAGLGTGTRIAGGWEVQGLNLPATGMVRARGRTIGGFDCGTSGIVEQMTSFTATPTPDIAVEQDPAGVNILDGGIGQLGGALVSNSIEQNFTIKNLGSVSLTGLGITIDGANSGEFVVTASPPSSVTSGGSSSFTVRFTPGAAGPRTATLHIASNDPDENPFDITLNATGLIPGDIDSTFDPNVAGSWVDATAVQPDGKIVIGGLFNSVGGQARSSITRLNSDGTVESLATFNTGTGANERVSGVAVQPDGKIVIVGFFTSINGQPRNRIARLNADGSLENSIGFNVGTGANDFVNTVAIQPDGKILIAGNFTTINGQARNRIARLNTDGTLESTATFNPNSGAYSAIYGLALQADGKILLAGYLNNLSGQPCLIARLHPNGALEDTSTFNPPSMDTIAWCVAVQPDGKILVGGNFSNLNGQTRCRVARLHADGSVESTSTFNPGGGANARVYSFALQADGKILMAGDFDTVNDLARGGVARLLPNGVVEDTSTFNIGTGAIGGVNGGANGVTVAPDGAIWLAGRFTSFNGSTRNHLARLVNGATSQALVVPNSTRVEWSRGGTAPEVVHVTFELSTDNGVNWMLIPAGNRFAGGWEATGLNLPPTGMIRARGRTTGGFDYGTSGIVEQVTPFSVTPNPDIAAEQPAGVNIPDGGSLAFGNAVVATSTSRTFTIKNPGYASLTGLGITIDGANSGDFTVTANPTTPVASGGSTTFTVNFTASALGSRSAALHIASNDPDESVFDITLIGTGVAAGYVDPTFDPNVTGTLVTATAIQSDGKVVIGGIFSAIGGQLRNNIARLHPDGSVESTATFDANTNGHATCVAVQPDGKIVIGGVFTSVNGQPRNMISRLNTDGTLESLVTFNPGTGLGGTGPKGGLIVAGLAVQPDGKMVISGGFTNVNGQQRNNIARLNADGTVESTATFNSGSGANHQVTSLALQADGKILLGGSFTAVNGQTRNRIARLNSDGSLDTAFGPVLDNEVNCVAVQPDGKILIGGLFTTVNSVPRNRIARLNADGTADSYFDPGSGADAPIYTLAVQADGKILVGGDFTAINGQSRNRCARLQANGNVDDTSAFDPGAGADNCVYDIALQPDGKILLGGLFSNVNGHVHNRFVKLANNVATQSLAISNSTRVQWLRGGSSPEVGQVTFELSTDSGAIWSPLGPVRHTAEGWECSLLNLPATGQIRARGRTSGGYLSSSSSFVEQMVPFAVTPSSDIAVEQPVGTNIFDGGSVSFGGAFVATSVSRTFTIKNPGSASLTGLGITIDGMNSSEFTVTTSPIAPVASGNGSTTFTVKFTPNALGSRYAALHIASNDPDESPFDITLSGTGATAGYLDEGFDPNLIGTFVEATAVQPDGKILIAGTFSSVGGEIRSGIARLQPDGSLESTATFNPGSGASDVRCVTLQADGKILIGGVFTTVDGQPRNHIARLNSDGTLESTATFNPGSGPNGNVYTMAVQPDGRILLGGDFMSVNGQTRGRIARLNADGTLEATASFNPGSGANSSVASIQVQPDNRILVGGSFTTFNGQARRGVIRLSADGALQTTFSPQTNNVVDNVTIQPDGMILIGGQFTTVNGESRNRIARLNADGSLEGTATFNPGTGANDQVTSVGLQANGKLLIVGTFTSVNGQPRNRIARLNANGSLENSPGFDALTGADNYIHSVALQEDGKILLGGVFTSMGGAPHNLLARLANDEAIHALAIPSSNLVQWVRGGSAPEVGQVSFEFATDGGADWSSLGRGTRTPGGWELTGLNLPATGLLRARGRTSGGTENGSSGLVEQIAPFSVTPNPDIAVEQPTGTNIPDGGSVDLSSAVVAANTSRTFTIRNPGYASLTGLGITIDGANSGDFTVTTSPTAPVASGGGRTTFTVAFTPSALGSRAAALHITSNDPDENSFDINLTGSGLAAGAVDPLFNPNASGQKVLATAVQPDGKILIGGLFTTVGGEARNNLARLNVDGTVENLSTFNPGTGPNLEPMSMAVQPDGKILLAGYFTSVDGVSRNGIARLNADGTLEGTATFNPGSGANDTVYSIALQADGKILLGGSFTSVNGQTRNGIARLNADGSVESTTTFNPGSGNNNTIYCVALQPDGKILLGGGFTSVNGMARNGIARLNADGSVESAATFNTGSGVSHAVGFRVYGIMVQPDGKILLGGTFDAVNGQPRNNLARLLPGGTLEGTSTFSAGSGFGTNDVVSSMALQTDGKILLGGWFTTLHGQPRNYFARLLPNGALEGTTAFDPGSGADNVVRDIAVQADGAILLGGYFANVNGQERGHFAKLMNDPASQTLTAPNSTRAQWTRGGAGPEVGTATFDLSTDGGSTWSPLGNSTRITGGWELTGLNLPGTGQIRARGRTAGGTLCGSAGLVEQTVPFSVTPNPDIAVEQPAGVNIPDGGSVAFGSAVVATSTSRTFTIKNPGHANLIGLSITIDGSNSDDFTVTASPTAPVASGGGSTSFTIQFTPAGSGARTAALHLASNDPDESQFDIALSGTGVAQGAVDLSFNPNVSGTDPLAQAIALQPDGKILVGGQFSTMGGQTRNNIARLLPDGTVESTLTFNVGSGTNSNGQIESIVVQADGKILIGGYFTTLDGQSRTRIARLNPNGSVESLTTFNPGSGANDWVRCMAVQPDGKILISGSFTTVNGQTRNRIARLNPDGSLESTVTFNPGTGASDAVFSIAVQADGKILLGGSFTNFDGQARNGIVRLNANGSLESTSTFNPGAGATGGTYGVFSVVVQADGKILIAGDFTGVNALSRNGIARLNPDGSVESSSTFSPGTGANGFIHGIALQTDGKILLGGSFTTVNGQARSRFARLNADGSLENTAIFDQGTGPNNMVAGVALQADGNILIGGLFTSVDGQTRNRFARISGGTALQTLSTPNSMQVVWLRGGAGPEVEQVTFELTTDGGTSWSLLGSGTRIAGGWEQTTLSLPALGIIRARGRTCGGSINASSGIVEQLQSFTVTPTPEIAVEQPAGLEIADGSTYSFGAVNVGTSASRTFTISNKGYANLTGIEVTIDGSDAAMFSVTSVPAVSVSSHSGSTTFTVSLDHSSAGNKSATLHIASNDADENPFDITLACRDPMTNANLSSLLLSEETLAPAFNSSITTYTASVPYGTPTVRVTPSAADPNALVRVNGALVQTGVASSPINLNIGANIITTRVVAEDGIASKSYLTTVNRATPVPGAVNPAFGDPNVVGSYVTATAVQPDGKILIGGLFTNVGGQTVGSLCRLNTDGSVESPATFNSGTGANGQVACIIVQADGKILIIGEFTSVNGQPRNYLARLNPDGTLESTATFNTGSGPNDVIKCGTLQADGKILIGGHFTTLNGQTRNHIARLNADGSLESSATFNPGAGANDNVYGMATQPDGKIVIGGQFTSFDGQSRNHVARLLPNGSVEATATFNPGTGADHWVFSIAVQADDKILIGGFFTAVNGQTRNRIARLNADGTLESAATFKSGTGANSAVYSLITQTDGKILMGGQFTIVDGQARNRIARLLADGTVENSTTFNIGTGANDNVLGVAMQADGGILLGGYFTSFNGAIRNRVAQLANAAVFETLSVPNASQVQWKRSGAGPEVEQVTFELSSDGGSNWIPLGPGTRISGGWEQTALSLSATGAIRARGRTKGGDLSCSSGIIEQIQSFANPPVAVTGAAGNLAIAGASLNATVTPNGSATAYLEYGPTAAYGSTTPVQNVTGAVALNVSAAIAGLAANSTYYYRVVATNAAGTVYGEDLSFATLPDPPTAVTANALAITSSSATLVGAVNPRNRATQVYFEYGSTTLYGNSTPVQNLAAGNSVVEVTANITGLAANATYHYRIVAISSGGTGYGSDAPFVSTSGSSATDKPSVTTGGASEVNTAAALLAGTVNPNGGFTNAFFEYGTTASLGSVSSNLGAGNGSVPANLSWNLSGLNPGTLYHYRLVASNSVGTTQGAILTFTTHFLPPVVTTGSAVLVGTTGAQVSGTVRARGATAQIFLDYGTDGVNFPNSVGAVPSTVEGDVETAVTAELTDLKQGITYHYRVRAVNSGGTGTGTAGSFTPAILSGLARQFPAVPPVATGSVTVTLYPANVVSGWRLAGELQWRASGSSAIGMSDGNPVLEFRPVPGFIQPAPEAVTLESGAAVTIERNYYLTESAGSGSLTVILKPDDLAAGTVPAADRVQWRFAGEGDGQWRNTGTAVASLPAGIYLIECKPVADRLTPPLAEVRVEVAKNAAPTLTYFLAPAPVGTAPVLQPLATMASDLTLPHAFVGQLRSNVGLSTGFVVKPRVVATAGHVVFDDGSLTFVTSLQWLFQRDHGSYEPPPQTPRGFYVFEGYEALRRAENSPGTSTPQSQNLDVAAMYFAENAGRGGFGGFLASDTTTNEFLSSTAPKLLVGYPVNGIPAAAQGRLHATPPAGFAFTLGLGRTHTTPAIRGTGGLSGGPLCVQHSNGNYYPAAIYLGGTAQTVVRAIDSEVIDLFNRAATSGGGGGNNTGGGVTHSGFTPLNTLSVYGSITVIIEPAAALDQGAGWRLSPETGYRDSGSMKDGLNPGNYILQFDSASGYLTPSPQPVTLSGGGLNTIRVTYLSNVNTAPTITALADRSAPLDSGATVKSFVIGDTETAVGELFLTVNSSNPALVPVGNLVIGGSGANRTLTATPVANRLGSATLTVTVSDGTLSGSSQFVLTVTGTPQEVWREAQFGAPGDTGNAADGADPDGDGKTNLDEYAAGTNPNDRGDYFRIQAATRTATSYTLTAAGKAGRSYVLERSAAPGSGGWTFVGSVGPLGADGPLELTDPTPPARAGFYRLRVSVP